MNVIGGYGGRELSRGYVYGGASMYPGSDICGRMSLEIPSMVLGYPALYVTPKVRAWNRGIVFGDVSHI